MKLNELLLGLKKSINNSGFRNTLYKIMVLLENIFRHPILIFQYIKVTRRIKYSVVSTINQLKLCSSGCYSTTLSFSDGIKIFIYHHNFIDSKFGTDRFNLNLNDRVNLWTLPGSNSIKMYLSVTEDRFNHEGLLILALHFEERPLCFLSFVICDGQLFNSFGPVLFITRIQGTPNEYTSIKYVNKLLGNLNLSNSLLSAASGFALSLGLKKIISVSSATQLSFKSDASSMNFYSTYDLFLIKNSALLDDGYFSLPVPLPSNKFNEDRAHRSRHKRHLTIRSEIAQSALYMLQKELQS